MTAWPVLITRRLPPKPMQFILDRCDADVWQDPPEAIPRDELLQRVRGKQGAITLLTERVDAEFLDAAGEQLKIVANSDLMLCAARLGMPRSSGRPPKSNIELLAVRVR